MTPGLARLIDGVSPEARPYEFADDLWRLLVDEVPTSFEVRSDRAPDGEHAPRWIASCREALDVVRTAEIVRREALAARRRRLPLLTAVPSCEELVRERVAALRRAAEHETDVGARTRAQLDALRAELPELHAQIRRRQAASDATRTELQRLENAYAASRARTEATYAASRRLDALAGASPSSRGSLRAL